MILVLMCRYAVNCEKNGVQILNDLESLVESLPHNEAQSRCVKVHVSLVFSVVSYLPHFSQYQHSTVIISPGFSNACEYHTQIVSHCRINVN